MRLIILFLLTLPLILSCSGEKAVYEQEANFNKFSASQLVEQVLIQDLGSNEFESLKSQARADVSWKDFWNALIEKKSLLIKHPKKLGVLLNSIAGICPEGTKDAILSNFIDALTKNTKSLETIKLINSKCTGVISESTKEIIRKFQRVSILSDDKSNDLILGLEIVLEMDEEFNKSVPYGLSPKYSLNAQEFASLGEKLLVNQDFKILNRILEIHRNLYPDSSKFRQQLVKKYLGDHKVLAMVLEKNSIGDLSDFLSRAILDQDYSMDSESANLIARKIVSKLDVRYNHEDPFYKNGNLMDEFLVHYFRFFNTVKYLKNLAPENLLTIFNDANRMAESVMLYDQESALSLLRKTVGADKLLADFHILRIESKITDRLPTGHSDYQISDLTSLDQLLIYRNQILRGSSESVEKYCKFLGKSFDFQEKTILLNEVESNLNKIGCFNVATALNLPAGQYNQLALSGKNLKSPYDALFRLHDTDIKLSFDFYDGPIWVTSSQRKYPRRKLKNLKNLDAEMIPLVLRIKMKANTAAGEDLGERSVVFNYKFKDSEYAPDKNQFDLNLLKGHRGGRLDLATTHEKSMSPIVISNGGIGEEGPEDILAGTGLNIDSILDLIDVAAIPEISFLTPGKAFYDSLRKALISINLDSELQEHLSGALCKTKFCLVSGEKKPSDIDSGVIDLKEVTLSFKKILDDYIAASVRSADLAKKFYETYYMFPAKVESKLGKTIFENGQTGEFGIITVNGSALQR